MKKILTVLGARPQFIKASVVSHAIAQKNSLTEVLVHTGQHFDTNMSDVFFKELGMPKPAYFLDIHGGSHGAMTGRMLAEVENVLIKEEPDVVMVYGDTNSTLAGALAAVKLHIPVVHVEAGLRSFNMAMPEEVNRTLTDRISTLLFTPTQTATNNLLHEGVAVEHIIEVGDVMYDAALHHGQRVNGIIGVMGKLGLSDKGYVLATVHRAENTDDVQRLSVIVDALEVISSELPVVWPIHPRTFAILKDLGRLEQLAQRVHITPPLGYLDMVQLEKYAAVIATDSGGVQKEAFFFRVPYVTLRDETEWVELVEAGWNQLVAPKDARSIFRAIIGSVGRNGTDINPYGDGYAGQRIAAQLYEQLN